MAAILTRGLLSLRHAVPNLIAARPVMLAPSFRIPACMLTNPMASLMLRNNLCVRPLSGKFTWEQPDGSETVMDERAQIQSVIDSMPPCGISVTVYQNNMEEAEKKFFRKIRQEGLIHRMRANKYFNPRSQLRRREIEKGLYQMRRRRMKWLVKQIEAKVERDKM